MTVKIITSAKFEVTLRGLQVYNEAEMEFLRQNLLKSLQLMGFFAMGREDDVEVVLVESEGEYQ